MNARAFWLKFPSPSSSLLVVEALVGTKLEKKDSGAGGGGAGTSKCENAHTRWAGPTGLVEMNNGLYEGRRIVACLFRAGNCEELT